LIIVAGALVAFNNQWKVNSLILLSVSVYFELVLSESLQRKKAETFCNICLGVSGGYGLFSLRFVIDWGSSDLTLDFIFEVGHRVALELKVYV
jgi:hypothetical protein